MEVLISMMIFFCGIAIILYAGWFNDIIKRFILIRETRKKWKK